MKLYHQIRIYYFYRKLRCFVEKNFKIIIDIDYTNWWLPVDHYLARIHIITRPGMMAVLYM